jgi:predicted metal-dependent phosphoesterase TrpH
MPEKYDLHCHSLASDGTLTPTEIVNRAKEQQVSTLALTDHDTTSGIVEARQAARKAGINLVPGIEISATWKNKTLHILGLNIDPENSELKTGIEKLQKKRLLRAKKIAEKLAKKNIGGALETITKAAGNSMITRTHFADFLLSNQHVNSQQQAFDYYLGQGKPAYVAMQWAELESVISWINNSGGIAVLAHPLRYKLTASWIKRLLAAFKAMGGEAIEVITGRSTEQDIFISAKYARDFDLSGSVGSDFHSPTNVWVELGRLAPLPADITPVWSKMDL